MKVKTVVKNLRVSPRKLNALLSIIRGQSIDYASEAMLFSRKKSAKPVLLAIKACMNDMRNVYNIDRFNDVYIHQAYVGKGMRLKRLMPRARGRGGIIKKTYSHLTVEIIKRDVQQDVKQGVK